MSRQNMLGKSSRFRVLGSFRRLHRRALLCVAALLLASCVPERSLDKLVSGDEVAADALSDAGSDVRPPGPEMTADQPEVADVPAEGTCQPDCQGVECGSNGCGGSCGECEPGHNCLEDICEPWVCTPGAKWCVGIVATVCNSEGSVVESETECDDQDECTEGDGCVNGQCKTTTVKDCDDQNPCTDDFCEPADGCYSQFNNAPCDDGNDCTTGDQCSQGECTPGELTCDCAFDSDCAVYEDGDQCNGSLHCHEGLCVVDAATVVECAEAEAECLVTACQPDTGECAEGPVEDGEPCDDGLECTVDDQCVDGGCVGELLACDDGNPCTDDLCDAEAGCVNEPADNDCDDGNACTSPDYCLDGVCVGDTLDCEDGNPCTANSCLPASGCQSEVLEGPCDDGDECTTNDTCVGAVCSGEPQVCEDDGNFCTNDLCDPDVGCVFDPNDLPCDDGNPCTTGDTCANGECLPGDTLFECNDNDECTTDSCDVDSGDCFHLPNSQPCDDGDPCTTVDQCANGDCAPGPQVDCDDGNPCTTDSCDAQGACKSAPASSACEDGNLCTLNDMCLGGACQPGIPVICDDGKVCTDDSCDEQDGCLFEAIPGCCDNSLLESYWEEGFESGVESSAGWEVDMPQGNDVGWHLLDGFGYEGEEDPDGWGFYYGNPADLNYDCGVLLCEGSAVTPYIDLAGVAGNAFVKLSFMLELSTEWDNVSPEQYVSVGIDTLYVDAIDEDQNETQVWSSDVINSSTHGEYLPFWVDLTDFAGETLRLQFRFSTGDVLPAANEFGGARIDELEIKSVCSPVCEQPSDCDELLGDCETPQCVGGECTHDYIDDCCTESYNVECDDANPCTNDECLLATSSCLHELLDSPECCFTDPAVYGTLFDELEGAGKWLPVDEGDDCGDWMCADGESCLSCPVDCGLCPVAWRHLEGVGVDGSGGLYFGNPESGTYQNGTDSAYGKIASPPLVLPAGGELYLSFDLMLDTEHCPVCQTFIEPNAHDKLSLHMQLTPNVGDPQWGAPQLVWDSMAWDVKGCTAGEQCAAGWRNIQVGLGGLGAGAGARFVYEFDSSDEANNSYSGVFVDNFVVGVECGPTPACLSAFECPEATPDEPHCSVEECVDGCCLWAPNPLKPGCCSQEVVDGASFNFDTGCNLQSWQSIHSSATVMWQAYDGNNHTEGGQCALYFGAPETGSYDDPGQSVWGSASSPEVNAKGYEQIQVSFWLWRDLEDVSWFLDTLTLTVDQVILAGLGPMGVPVTLWQSPCAKGVDEECAVTPADPPCDELGCETVQMGKWTHHSLNFGVEHAWDSINGGWIPGLDDRIVIFEFEFNSADADNNGGEGVYVDDFQVKTLCQ